MRQQTGAHTAAGSVGAHGWAPRPEPDLAALRILDAAGRCFARSGVGAVSISQVASEAGCSRPTVYRYFPDRHALRTAFVDREAARLSREVARSVATVTDPGTRLVAAVEAALAGVRGNAVLAAWFTPRDSGSTAEFATTSGVIARAAESLLDVGPADDGEAARRARWLVRVILSLLAQPAGDPDEERRLIEEFVVPVVLP